MRPLVINGKVWRIVRVAPGDPRLIDRTSRPRLATTDSSTSNIYIVETLVPPLLDRVLLHEVAHAITISYGLLGSLHSMIPVEYWIAVEEYIAQIVENFSIEAAIISSESLGRPLCVHGYCISGERS